MKDYPRSVGWSFFIAQFYQTKGDYAVKDWKDRLIRCGIPEDTAQRIIDYFYKHRRMIELIAYVRMTEEGTGKQ